MMKKDLAKTRTAIFDVPDLTPSDDYTIHLSTPVKKRFIVLQRHTIEEYFEFHDVILWAKNHC